MSILGNGRIGPGHGPFGGRGVAGAVARILTADRQLPAGDERGASGRVARDTLPRPAMGEPDSFGTRRLTEGVDVFGGAA
ncbi:hypothetical protein [Nocardia aurea]|uniref:hypothetical protein n=1 Tax=Nocardia aurea TaxID=2144174 RepID=UPI0033A91B3F